MLIAKEVLTAIGHPWFRWPENWNKEAGVLESISDDMDFCAAALAKGFRIWADGRVRCGHLKLVDVSTLIDGNLQWPGGRRTEIDGWGSHIPALIGIGRTYPIRTVVEFGSGRYSTPTFLDRTYFPQLEKIISYEPDPDWLEDTKRRNTDARLEMVLCPLDKMHTVERALADLIFIDCDQHDEKRYDYAERLKLIQRYSSDPHAVVVVHDSNFTQIKPAIDVSPYRYKYVYVPAFGPHTAVLSNGVDVTGLGKAIAAIS
jgi:hypothetical protein